MTRALRRLGVVLALGIGLCPLLAGWAGDGKKPRLDQVTGKVMPRADLPAKVRLDADADMVLLTDDGTAYALFKDAGARMFAKDRRLLNRPMRLSGKLLKGNVIQVINVHSLKKGRLHDVYYWCDICTIKGFENGICECCGAPMDLREVPLP